MPAAILATVPSVAAVRVLGLAWLFAIARYKLIDFGRRRRKDASHEDIKSIEDTLEAPVFSSPDAATELDALLAKLPERSRRALTLVKIDGLTVAEAAARTQMSVPALKVTVHRALKALKGRFK